MKQSELIKHNLRLYAKNSYEHGKSTHALAADLIEALEAEADRLRELVESAYLEGHACGRYSESFFLGAGDKWPMSVSKAALNQPQDQ